MSSENPNPAVKESLTPANSAATAPTEKKPWSTPTVKEVDIATSEPSSLKAMSMAELETFATKVHKSEFCPKGFKTAGDVLVAMVMATDLGMPPLLGLQNIGVINGRPGIYGDAALALVRRSGLLEDYKEETIGEGDSKGIKITVKRYGFDAASQTFTVADAKKAGLWGKAGPWTQYPARMLMFRARGFVLRDQFGDVLKGMVTYEEARDYSHAERADRAKPVNAGFEIAHDPSVTKGGVQ